MYKVAVFGAGGYSGIELLKLLAHHPDVQVVCAASDGLAPSFVGDQTGIYGPMRFVTLAEAEQVAADVAFLCVPAEPAAPLAAALVSRMRVIDLSHAHRGVAGVPYGLVSLFGDEVREARLVANPGCYATAVITALAPLVRDHLIEHEIPVVAYSGVTGAGRKVDQGFALGELYGNVHAYRVLAHQHVPEMERSLARVATGPAPRVIFTPHLLPLARGILATATVKLRAPRTTAQLIEVFERAYGDDPTVEVARRPEAVGLREVVGTPRCRVGVATDGTFAIVTAALDNLMKGAASQAIENFNLMHGLPRLRGLEHATRFA
ncbi:MAG TPA: N-acetyl-gamma-glutamyl-phosphate reductase [Kofleriaceae bacterium]|jgi:N-acetyl-gamma-glutamyl-phosphate reductase